MHQILADVSDQRCFLLDFLDKCKGSLTSIISLVQKQEEKDVNEPLIIDIEIQFRKKESGVVRP